MNKPSISERIKKCNANNENRKSEEYERIKSILQNRHRLEESLQRQDELRFEMYLTAGDILRMLERQRDENVPKTPWEKWNWKFRVAVEQIPIWRRIVDDAAMDCMKARK